MSAEKITRMANQIAQFMETKPHAEGVTLLA
ncbi:MAG: formate dehydrogenase, partial [Acetobacteraceae bacterium]